MLTARYDDQAFVIFGLSEVVALADVVVAVVVVIIVVVVR
jgi:hypothetical protein